MIFQADHPAVQGHFPGNPIIPGAVLLGEVLREFGAMAHGGSATFRLVSAKFLHPVRPGDRILIELSRGTRDEVGFTCTVEGTPVLTGRIACRLPSTAT